MPSTPGQHHSGFHVMGPRELVEHRTPADAVGVVQLGDVGCQSLRIAGDVQDVVEAPGQLAGCLLYTSPSPRDS